jgi:hypothetical protein
MYGEKLQRHYLFSHMQDKYFELTESFSSYSELFKMPLYMQDTLVVSCKIPNSTEGRHMELLSFHCTSTFMSMHASGVAKRKNELIQTSNQNAYFEITCGNTLRLLPSIR